MRLILTDAIPQLIRSACRIDHENRTRGDRSTIHGMPGTPKHVFHRDATHSKINQDI
jgi:hypothetical protein